MLRTNCPVGPGPGGCGALSRPFHLWLRWPRTQEALRVICLGAAPWHPSHFPGQQY